MIGRSAIAAERASYGKVDIEAHLEVQDDSPRCYLDGLQCRAAASLAVRMRYSCWRAALQIVQLWNRV